MLYAPWGRHEKTSVEIPLPAKGDYRIDLGLAGTRYPLDEAPFAINVRLKREAAPVTIDAVAPSADAGWWFQPVECTWKHVALDGDTLVVSAACDSRAALLWVRLVPVDVIPDHAHPKHAMVVTNDAYRPFDSLEELFAPIMRLAGTPVARINYCVGNGAYAFAVPSKVAISSDYVQGGVYDNRYARDTAMSYAKLHREHPDVLKKLVDFTHAQGMAFDVSFRTGCTLDCMRYPEKGNAAEPDAAARGICRTENYCRHWDGTVVPRFSYAKDEVQDFFLRFYAEMLDGGADGINLIWIRALPAMLFEPAFREKFRKRFGEALADANDPRVAVLRADIMTDFHRRVRALAGSRHFSIFVPADGKTCEAFGLDVARLAREGIVDDILIGNSLQDARHTEGFRHIDFAYFKKALAGTKTTFRPYFTGRVDEFKTAIAEGAAGVAYWDAAARPWVNWETYRRLTDDDGTRAIEELKGKSLLRVHPLKTLDGFDYARYPWHVAY